MGGRQRAGGAAQGKLCMRELAAKEIVPTHPSLYGDMHHERGRPYSAIRRECLREEIPLEKGR